MVTDEVLKRERIMHIFTDGFSISTTGKRSLSRSTESR